MQHFLAILKHLTTRLLDGMATKDINLKWQAMMAEFFVTLDGRRPDEGFLRLEDVFFLP